MTQRRHGCAHGPVRWLAGLAALALSVAACEQTPLSAPEDDRAVVIEEEQQSSDATAPESGDGDATAQDGDAHAGTAGPGETAEGADGSTGSQPASSEEPSEPDPEQDSAPAAVITDDRGPLGSACRPYLRGEVPALTIEVLHHAGARPSSGALDHLVASLAPVLDKPAGIEVAGPREIPGQARTWELDELRELAARHRQVASDGERAGMLVLSVAGEFEDPGVLGLAMNATEVVLFPQQIGDLGTTLLGGSERIERAVLLHEAGHLLCLVNIGYESDIDHEDPDHPHHSRHRDSVMYWAVPNDAVSQVFSGPPPDTFHEDDLADLRGLRDGRY